EHYLGLLSAHQSWGRSWMLPLPLLPFLTRFIVCFCYRRKLFCHLPSAARDEEAHRTSSLEIAGFSVTIFAGLVVLEGTVKGNLEIAIFFAAISFIMYFLAHAVQG